MNRLVLIGNGFDLAHGLKTAGRWDRYLGMTAAMTQVPVPTAIRPQRYLHAAIPPHAAQAAGGSTPAAATKKKQTEIKHFNINNKNEKDSAPDLWSLV